MPDEPIADVCSQGIAKSPNPTTTNNLDAAMFVIRIKRPVPAQGRLFAGVPFPSSLPCPNDPTVMSINADSASGAHLRLPTDLDHVGAFVESHTLQRRVNGTRIGEAGSYSLQCGEKDIY